MTGPNRTGNFHMAFRHTCLDQTIWSFRHNRGILLKMTFLTFSLRERPALAYLGRGHLIKH